MFFTPENSLEKPVLVLALNVPRTETAVRTSASIRTSATVRQSAPEVSFCGRHSGDTTSLHFCRFVRSQSFFFCLYSFVSSFSISLPHFAFTYKSIFFVKKRQKVQVKKLFFFRFFWNAINFTGTTKKRGSPWFVMFSITEHGIT